jgi:hypothetical protein
MDKNRETAGHEYFSQLYGATSPEGEPQQTVFDRWRDKILCQYLQEIQQQ